MKPSASLALKKNAVRETALRFHTVNPRIFGAIVHENDEEGSDLDLLVDPLPGITLFDLGGLQVELACLLGVPIDVLTPGAMPIKFRAQVLAEARTV